MLAIKLLRFWMVLALITPLVSVAGFVRANSRLDQVLESDELCQIFVVRIKSIRIYDDFPSQTHRVNLKGSVVEVVFGQELKPEQEVAYDEAFAWPENLVPSKEDQRCILITVKENNQQPRLAVVMPLSSKQIGAVEKAADARPLLIKELLNELKLETLPVRQRLLIRQVTPILSKDEVVALLPYLESKDEWVRRAALAALVYIGRDEKYSNLAADDLREVFKNHSDDKPIKIFADWDNRGCDYSPYPLLFEYYYYLHSNPCPRSEEVALVKFLLPLYRAVAMNLKDSPQDNLLHGSGPLHHFGTAADIPYLYKSHDDADLHNRACGLAAISRILNLGLIYTNDDAFLAKEELWQEKVKKAVQALPVEQK